MRLQCVLHNSVYSVTPISATIGPEPSEAHMQIRFGEESRPEEYQQRSFDCRIVSLRPDHSQKAPCPGPFERSS